MEKISLKITKAAEVDSLFHLYFINKRLDDTAYSAFQIRVV